jgi:hypothetical protein
MSALALGQVYSGEHNLACPACGSDYSHIREVFTRLGCDPGERTVYPGTTARDGGSTRERRSALVAVFDGECGHVWELVVQQHKGINGIATVPVAG